MSEKDTRLEIVRQYLLDVESNPGALIEASDAISYVRYNFDRAFESALAEADAERKVVRLGVSEDHGAETEILPIESDIVELKIGQMGSVIESKGRFLVWFHKSILAPILAEEARILRYSSSPDIRYYRRPSAFIERAGRSFQFKAWEIVWFPSAKDVPPRVEPAPEEGEPVPGTSE